MLYAEAKSIKATVLMRRCRLIQEYQSSKLSPERKEPRRGAELSFDLGIIRNDSYNSQKLLLD